ncbi:MAG: inositol monophosphatase [Thermoplasmatales archaeon]|nr:inositol monophosphatase [Thermoplasmatales archaeon]
MEKLIELARKAVDEIDKKIREEDRNKFSEFICMGANGTPTNYIDKVAEEIGLKIIGKEANILSEECGFIDNGSEYTFIIDPVDGTRNAIAGIPFYGVSIAIGKESLNDILYGIVKNIPTGDVFEAFAGKGAFLNNRRIRVRKAKKPFLCLVLGESGNEKTWKIANRHHVRAMGAASLEMCLVASGAVQAYYMGRRSLRITDFAASSLIVKEAGGIVRDEKGEELDLPFDLNVRSGIIAVCNEEMIEVLI